ncbi:hypothetical protein A2U01_0117576, partial [Trifolium medium]|nr:hypothetical protein [Trifolium medium]
LHDIAVSRLVNKYPVCDLPL